MEQKIIKFEDFFPVEDSKRVKVKFNMNPGDSKIYAWDLLYRDDDRWLEMNEWKKQGDGNNMLEGVDYLLAFAQYYPYDSNYYIFGGYYQIVENKDIKEGRGYKLKLLDKFSEFRKRLIVKFEKAVGQSYNLYYDTVINKGPVVYEITPPIKMCDFKGYSDVCLTHRQMQDIFNGDSEKWKNALSRVKAIYCITDKKDGKLYIGSATDDVGGLWGRWKSYANTSDLTGGNKAFEELLRKEGPERIINYFTYTILEIFDMRTDRGYIQSRENYWKDVFKTRDFGFNKYEKFKRN